MRLNRLRLIILLTFFLVCILFFTNILEQLFNATTGYRKVISYSIPNDLCRKTDLGFVGLLLITSYTENKGLRASHRAAVSQRQLDELNLVRIFLLGQVSGANHSVSQQELLEEQQQHGDLLQGHFEDDYRSNNYKAFMGFSWALFDCGNVDFVIKLNDDVVFDVFHLNRYMIDVDGGDDLVLDSGSFLAGMKFSNSSPQREEGHKFFVTHEEYSGTMYPNYVSRSLYITTLPTVRRLMKEASNEPAFWIDDIWFTGILRENLKIPIAELNSWFLNDSQYFECCVQDLKEHNYECGYYVGPLDGKPNLLVEFTQNVEMCYNDDCLQRPKGQSVLDTCVKQQRK